MAEPRCGEQYAHELQAIREVGGHQTPGLAVAAWVAEVLYHELGEQHQQPEVVRKLAGHSDIKTTMQYYSKVTEEQRRKAADVTDRLLEMGLAAGSTGTYEG